MAERPNALPNAVEARQPIAVAAPSPRRRGFFGRLWLALRQLFHEATGALFLVLALSWTAASIRLWEHGGATWLLGTTIGFALLMVFFGVTSFLTSRRLR